MRFNRRSQLRSTRGHVRLEQEPTWTNWIWRVAAILLGLAAVGVAIQQVVLPMLKDEPAPSDNRTWLEFAWTSNPVNPDAVHQLGDRLKLQEITWVYLESSAWRNDGTLLEGEYAADFAAELRNAYPGIKILLWLRMSGDEIGDPDRRTLAITLAGKAVREWNFDGVQLNGRAVIGGSESYIQLLRDLRGTIGPDALLSLTVPPDRIPTDPDVPIGPVMDPGLTWDVNYKQRVGLLMVDEVVIMAHASGLTDPEEYQTWVAYQIDSYVSALSELDHSPDIIVALPTYDAAPEHDPAVEDVRTAINGVKQGIKQVEDHAKLIKGVGLYEYKTTDSLEWTYYTDFWLKSK